MKKVSLLALLVIASIVIVSCTATKAETPEMVSEAPATTVVEPVEEVVVSEPVEQTAVEQPVVEEAPLVIDEAPAISATDPEIEQKFSYVYGHLLTQGIKEQEIALVPRHFIAGSDTFFQYAEPAISEEEINTLFSEYQSYLDGTISQQELETMEVAAVGDMSTFYDLFSYGYGYVVQYNLQSQGILVDIESFHNGVSDAFNDVPLNYSDEDIDTLFMAYQEKLMADYEVLVEEFAAENLANAEAFLAENALDEEVITTESGLQYKVITEGEGAYPTESDTVKLDYMITFLDGSTGDNSYSRGEPSVFNLANLIPGFKEGVQLMPVGSHYRFYVHPAMAYTERGTDTIPPNTLLIFDVELHEIVTE